MGQNVPEISKPSCWVWKDGRFGKTEKKGVEGNGINIGGMAPLSKSLQESEQKLCLPLPVLLSQGKGWKGTCLRDRA